MTWTREDAEIERDEREARRLKTQCQCHPNDMPGFCPGAWQCPLADHDEDDDDA